ncbi:catalase [uncultured Algoriphagus sp.]|uniref:catalase n=1 Tax=uncultured Algoriphagus sp. TaxID=417365 RepID=UPI0030EEDE17|tara:strand:+ start:11776 stop:13944 length:2169 start_codon:yes stop_codon:yes gene_type:complete
MSKKNNSKKDSQKIEDLQKNYEESEGQKMTTNQGLKINDDTNSLKAGERGATLLEDFILREKITHFDHERIPERIVHARGSGAHGIFKVYDDSLKKYTKAKFLTDPSRETPVFTRFSTVAGFRGSADVPRDVRGFAVKFYTEEGNYDLVGNNMPVFFIQDAIKFPDLIHAVKPEPDNEIPQAASAHNTFWDFVSLSPETMHNVMWLMSDRAIPRSLRMMEGFGIHTFRLINEKGESHFVKFHWKPLLGTHSVVWDEALKINGQDPDFHRRDLYEAIAAGSFPEWELGVQIVPEADEHKFDFDLLDPTKLIPEEIVPVQRIGKMTLNRNPENFFAETEQIAFHPGHLVPGIDFTNDPLLQGRLFSYTDTQLSRLGGPNFHEIPINRPINTIHNNQRDGIARMEINRGKTSYHPNSIRAGYPEQAKESEGGFSSYQERVDANKVRARSRSFMDFFSQPALFYNSLSEPEQNHVADAFAFELGKVDMPEIRQRVVGLISQVNYELAEKVAEALSLEVKDPEQPINHQFGADANPKDYQPIEVKPKLEKSPALSMANTVLGNIKTRQIAFLTADGVNGDSVNTMKKALEAEGAIVKIIAPKSGMIKDSSGNEIKVDHSFLTFSSVLVDAIFIPSGDKSIDALKKTPKAIHFIDEAFLHCKAIATEGQGVDLVNMSYVKNYLNAKPKDLEKVGLLTGEHEGKDLSDRFIKAIGKHRFFEREKGKIPA